LRVEEVDRSEVCRLAQESTHVDVLAEDRRHKAELFLALENTNERLMMNFDRLPLEGSPLSEGLLLKIEVLAQEGHWLLRSWVVPSLTEEIDQEGPFLSVHFGQLGLLNIEQVLGLV